MLHNRPGAALNESSHLTGPRPAVGAPPRAALAPLAGRTHAWPVTLSWSLSPRRSTASGRAALVLAG